MQINFGPPPSGSAAPQVSLYLGGSPAAAGYAGSVGYWPSGHRGFFARHRALRHERRSLMGQQAMLQQQQTLSARQADLQKRQELQASLAKVAAEHHKSHQGREHQRKQLAALRQQMAVIDARLGFDKLTPDAANSRATSMLAQVNGELTGLNASLGLTGLSPADASARVSSMLQQVGGRLDDVDGLLAGNGTWTDRLSLRLLGMLSAIGQSA